MKKLFKVLLICSLFFFGCGNNWNVCNGLISQRHRLLAFEMDEPNFNETLAKTDSLMAKICDCK